MSFIANNLSVLRKSKGYSQQKVADAIQIPRSTLSGYEQGYAEPDLSKTIQFAKFFGVSLEMLLEEQLSPEKVKEGKQQKDRIVTVGVDRRGETEVQLVSTKAEAGYVENFNDPEFIRQLPVMRIPQLPKGVLRGFEIQGESMLPLEPGSIVIALYVENLEDVKEGETYVVATREGLVYKRLFHDLESMRFVLVSDNPLYPPYSLDLSEIKEIWKYRAHLSFQDGKSTFDAMLDDRMQAIHDGVHEIREFLRKGEGR